MLTGQSGLLVNVEMLALRRSRLVADWAAWCAAAAGLLLLVGAAPVGAPQPLTLVAAGQPAAVIVRPDPRGRAQADQRQETLAVEALVAHLRQMSGAELPVITESELGTARVTGGRIVPDSAAHQGKVFILVGEGELTRQLGLSSEGLGAGGMLIKTGANSIALLGRLDGSTAGGTAYAAFTLLEHLGVRYLWPGELGTVIPTRATVVVPALEQRYSPPILQRHIRIMPKGPRNFDAGREFLGLTEEDHAAAAKAATAGPPVGWANWHRLGSNSGIKAGHAGYGLRNGWDLHKDTHPEWFALQADGTRDQSRAGGRFRVCVTNPELIEHVAALTIATLNEAPNTVSVPLSPNDGGHSGHCLCERCKALDPPDGHPTKIMVLRTPGDKRYEMMDYVSISDRYVWYWNQIAQRVTKVHPNVLLTVDAYADYAAPPVREKVHPSLVVRYVPNKTEGWDGWKAAGARRIFWRPNNLHSGYQTGLLQVTAPHMADTLGYMAENGTIAVDMQGIYHNWATQGLDYYAAGRLSWDPTLTYEQVLDDYCQSGFGAGAQHMKAYYQRANEVPRDGFTPEVIAELGKSLAAAAEKAAGDEAARRRIAFVRLGLTHTALTAEALRLQDSADAAPKAVQDLMDRRWALMRHIFTKDHMAVNVAIVAGMEAPLRNRLKWAGPGAEFQDKAKQRADDSPDWLYEDQTLMH